MTAITNPRVLELQARLADLEEQQLPIQEALKAIREACSHPLLPKHELGERYMDTCPDCGHASYCY